MIVIRDLYEQPHKFKLLAAIEAFSGYKNLCR